MAYFYVFTLQITLKNVLMVNLRSLRLTILSAETKADAKRRDLVSVARPLSAEIRAE